MIDAFDVMAFAVFGVLLVVTVILVVTVGQLPGRIAQKRGHPQAAAINVASWLGAPFVVSTGSTADQEPGRAKQEVRS
jgi:hypothetical protein